MRLASFTIAGRRSFGVVHDDKVWDLGRRLRGGDPCDLKTWLSTHGLNSLPETRLGSSDYSLSDLILDPVIPNPTKILCVGLNYDAHRAESGRAQSKYPVIFTRFGDTLVGHRGSIVCPSISSQLDFEGELAVVIGRAGFRIPEERAFEFVAGYAPFNDASARDWQSHTHQFTPGKNFPATGGFGPFVTSREEVDIADAMLTTYLNGCVVQRAALTEMIFSIPRIISYVSSFTPLMPGDVVATGTPAGVGMKRAPPVFLMPGDVVEVEIDGVGRLSNTVVAETARELSAAGEKSSSQGHFHD